MLVMFMYTVNPLSRPWWQKRQMMPVPTPDWNIGSIHHLVDATPRVLGCVNKPGVIREFHRDTDVRILCRPLIFVWIVTGDADECCIAPYDGRGAGSLNIIQVIDRC